LRAFSAVVVLAWVVVKATALTLLELGRAVLRFIADPVGETRRGWKWLAMKIGVSVWVRQLFTLAAARDVYTGVPAIYVNYIDYDVFAHAYGPRHRRALRALRRTCAAVSSRWQSTMTASKRSRVNLRIAASASVTWVISISRSLRTRRNTRRIFSSEERMSDCNFMMDWQPILLAPY